MISNKNLARIAGLLYLVVIVSGLFAEVFVRQALKVPGDAMATAHNIRSSEMLFRVGFVADLVNFVVGIPSVLIVYILFSPASKQLTRLALIFVVIQTAIIAVNLLNQISPLVFLGNGNYLKSFEPAQLATLAQHALNLQGYGYGIGLVFFGCYCLLIGFVILKSSLIPRLLGILYMITGISYLLNSFTLFLFPTVSDTLFPYFAVPAFIGEISLCLWLLVMGVRENKPANKNVVIV